MAETVWQIEQDCPQCAGPVVLEEIDRLLCCPYCRVRLYIHAGGVLRYTLPARRARAEELLLIPYWRFKGQAFSCVPFEVRTGIVDLSRRAVEFPGIPDSLGVRTQAVRLRFAAPETPGEFVRPELPEDEAVAACQRVYNRWSSSEKVFHQAFVGETASIVYLPVAVRESIYDALVERPIAPLPPGGIDREGLLDRSRGPAVRFLPTLCPICGWDLEAEKDSLALLCRNCRSAWEARGSRLEALRFATLPADFEPDLQLPFWRIKPRIVGLQLRSFADLARFANLPKLAQPAWEDQELLFWIPAFKVHPRYFLRIAKTLTLAQPAEVQEDRLPSGAIYPVTLPATESADTLKILLAELARPKRRFFPRLSEVAIHAAEVQLVFVPFRGTGRELDHPGLRACIPRNLLAYGRNL